MSQNQTENKANGLINKNQILKNDNPIKPKHILIEDNKDCFRLVKEQYGNEVFSDYQTMRTVFGLSHEKALQHVLEKLAKAKK